MKSDIVRAVYNWKTNGHLIQGAWKLGYVHGNVLDVTPGERTWWKELFPGRDLSESCHIAGVPPLIESVHFSDHDFRNLPSDWSVNQWDTVCFDPPYKLNGTPDPAVDARYGVDEATPWRHRHHLMAIGFSECVRVLAPGGHLLVKCMDQVCSGKVRWQTDMVSRWGEEDRLEKVDRFDMSGHARPQPMEGRQQRHAHGRGSTLLVFRKPGA